MTSHQPITAHLRLPELVLALGLGRRVVEVPEDDPPQRVADTRRLLLLLLLLARRLPERHLAHGVPLQRGLGREQEVTE